MSCTTTLARAILIYGNSMDGRKMEKAASIYSDWRAATPWGETRPDYGRKEVRQFIRDNAMMWLEDFHMDGLRMDSTIYIRSVRGDNDPGCDLPEGWSLAQWINGEIREKYPTKI